MSDNNKFEPYPFEEYEFSWDEAISDLLTGQESATDGVTKAETLADIPKPWFCPWQQAVIFGVGFLGFSGRRLWVKGVIAIAFIAAAMA